MYSFKSKYDKQDSKARNNATSFPLHITWILIIEQKWIKTRQKQLQQQAGYTVHNFLMKEHIKNHLWLQDLNLFKDALE